jgi:hypothetical protein
MFQTTNGAKSFHSFSFICKNKFVFIINDKIENNTESLKIVFGKYFEEATGINISIYKDFLFQLLRFQLS